MQHQLHPACFVEEPLEHEALLGGDGAQDYTRRSQVLDDGARTGFTETDRVHQPLCRCCRIIQPVGHILAQPGDFFRQLIGAARRLAEPERQRRRLAFGIGHAHLTRLHLHDLVRHVPQLEDVARHALDREVLVQRPHERLGRLENHAIVAQIRDCAA